MALEPRGAVAAFLGLGVLTGAVLVNLVPSIALVVLLVTLLTAAALAPLVAGAPEADWAGAAIGRLCDLVARSWPGGSIDSPRDRRTRLFAYLAGLNLAVFAAIFLRAGA